MRDYVRVQGALVRKDLVWSGIVFWFLVRYYPYLSAILLLCLLISTYWESTTQVCQGSSKNDVTAIMGRGLFDDLNQALVKKHDQGRGCQKLRDFICGRPLMTLLQTNILESFDQHLYSKMYLITENAFVKVKPMRLSEKGLQSDYSFVPFQNVSRVAVHLFKGKISGGTKSGEKVAKQNGKQREENIMRMAATDFTTTTTDILPTHAAKNIEQIV